MNACVYLQILVLEPPVKPDHDVDSRAFGLLRPDTQCFVERIESRARNRVLAVRYSETPSRLVPLAKIRHTRYTLMLDKFDNLPDPAGLRIVQRTPPDDVYPFAASGFSEFDSERARYHTFGCLRALGLHEVLQAVEAHFTVHEDRDDQYVVMLTEPLCQGLGSQARLAELRRQVPFIGTRRCLFVPDKAALALFRLFCDIRFTLVYDFRQQAPL